MLVIRDWMRHYESAQSRSVGKLSWVRVPNSHDTQGYCRLMALPDSMALFGAFVLIVQVASKCPDRGILADSEGVALDAYDIAAQCRGSAEAIQKAVEVLTNPKIGWLVECDNHEEALILSGREALSENGLQLSARYQQTASSYQQTAKNHQPATTEKRREEKRREEEREERNFERASGRSTALGERSPARPPRDGSGPTGSAGATPASEPGERLQPQRALVDLTWQAIQGRFPDVDRSMAERVAVAALQEAEANGLSPADLERRISDYVRQATRPKQRSAGMYLTTVPEEIRTRGKEAGKVAVITCDRCGDRGYVPRAEGRFWPDSSAIAGAIDRGEARLCECEAGEGWQALFANLAAPMRDKNGREIRTGFRAPGSVAV